MLTIRDFVWNAWAGAPEGTYHVKAHTTRGIAHATDRGQMVADNDGNSYWSGNGEVRDDVVPGLEEAVTRLDYLVHPS